MSRFTDAIVEETGFTYPNGRVELVCVTALAYEAFFLGSGWLVTAPAGFRSDGVSASRLILKQLPTGRMRRAAIIHDLMRKEKRYPKLLGDYIFLEAMLVEGVPWPVAAIAFLAVLVNFSRF